MGSADALQTAIDYAVDTEYLEELEGLNSQDCVHDIHARRVCSLHA